jgi:hypothetical protein
VVTRARIVGLAGRIEALAAKRTKRIVVRGPDETSEEALMRVDPLGRVENCIFILTGVPRPREWDGGRY